MSTQKPAGNQSSTKCPLISVLIPTYNRADLISEAIDSVLAQKYTPLEIVVVDDGSTDNTRKIVANYDPQIVKYFFQKNSGISNARNHCLRRARGQYIAWLDSDDRYLPGKLRAQYKYLLTHQNCEIVFTRFKNFITDRKIHQRARTANEIRLAKYYRHYLPSALIKKSVFTSYGDFLEQLAIGEDTELLFRFKVFGLDLSHCLDKVYYKRRLHHTNVSFAYRDNLYVATKDGKPYNHTLANLRKIVRPKYRDFAPKISVIIPVYNGEKYLAASIKSVQNQTLSANTEIIVIDNGSTDRSVNIATKLGCRVFSISDRGAVIARNFGLKKAHGDYLVFHDADDLLNKNALSLMYGELCKYDDAQAVFTMREDFISPELNINQKEKLRPMRASFGAMAGCAMIKKEVFEVVPFDESLVAGDIAWQMQLMDAEIRFRKLAHVTCKRRLHNNNFSNYYQQSEFRDYAHLLRQRLKKKSSSRYNYLLYTQTLRNYIKKRQQLLASFGNKLWLQEKKNFYRHKVSQLRLQRELSPNYAAYNTYARELKKYITKYQSSVKTQERNRKLKEMRSFYKKRINRLRLQRELGANHAAWHLHAQRLKKYITNYQVKIKQRQRLAQLRQKKELELFYKKKIMRLHLLRELEIDRAAYHAYAKKLKTYITNCAVAQQESLQKKEERQRRQQALQFKKFYNSRVRNLRSQLQPSA